MGDNFFHRIQLIPQFTFRCIRIGRYNSIIPFRWIGDGNDKKLIGFIKDSDGTSVYDGSGNQLIKICGVDENYSINWGENVQLTSPQQRYIVDEVRKLKQLIW